MKYILAFTIAIFSLCCNIAFAANPQANESTNNSVETTVPAQLPQGLLAKFNNELAKLKVKAEAQKTPKKTERIMGFYWQYRNNFDAMPVNSQIDVLNIFSTGDDSGSKLKGQKLIDKAIEYMVLIDGGFTEENVNKLRKYHSYIVKFNKSADIALNLIVEARITELNNINVATDARIAATDARIAEKIKRLEILIDLRKQMEKLAK